MRMRKLALLAILMAGVASAAAHSIEGTMRKLAEKDLLLQTGANMVLHLRLLALTQFRDRHGEPLRDSLLRPGDELSVAVNRDDPETALKVVLVRQGTEAEYRLAKKSVSKKAVRAPLLGDLAEARVFDVRFSGSARGEVWISSVTFKGSPAHPTVVIKGHGFLPRPAPDKIAVLGCNGGDLGGALRFLDATAPTWFSAGFDAPHGHNDIGLVILTYSDRQISYTLGSNYSKECRPSDNYRLNEGDVFDVHIRNQRFSGIVHYVN